MWSAGAIEHYRTCISAQRIFSNDVEIARLLLQHRSRAAWNGYLYYSIEYPKSQHQAKFEVLFLVLFFLTYLVDRLRVLRQPSMI